MNLHDNILRILADGPLIFNGLRQAINDISDPKHPGSEQWLTEQLRLMEWRGHVVKDADGKYSLPLKDGA